MLTFGAYLRALRTERGWTQTELGRRAKISQVHLSHIELGQDRPTMDALERLVQAIDPPDVPRFIRLGVIASAPTKWQRYFVGVV